MINKTDKNSERVVRHARVRKNISGTKACPRLAVFRSLNGIYAQIIDDEKGQTIASANTLEKELVTACKGKTKTQQAELVGKTIAERAIKAKIKTVVFDRGGHLYIGRVKALADAARNAGLKF